MSDQTETLDQQPLESNVQKATVVAMNPQFRDVIVQYLETRPHKEVRNLITELEKLKPFELTING